MSDPKKGRKMQPVTTAEVTDGIAERLYGKPIKTVAREIGCNPWTVKNYKTGRNAPSARQLIMLARQYEDVRAWLLQMIDPPADEELALELAELKRRLARLENPSEGKR